MISRLRRSVGRPARRSRGLAATALVAALAAAPALASGGVAAASDTASAINPCASSFTLNDIDLSSALGVGVSVDGSATTEPPGVPITYTVTDLPPGLSIDPRTGLITGTPTTAGLYYPEVTAWNCGFGAGQQGNWRITSPGAVVRNDGLCLDVRGGNFGNNTPVQAYTCDGTFAQRWAVDGVQDFTLHALGKCLDAYQGGQSNGTPVVLYACNGSLTQLWGQTTTGDLINVGSGLCPASLLNESGLQLQFWPCGNDGTFGWTLP
jgi:hypothetical protein